MPDILGVVPALGRGALVHQALAGGPLCASAVDLLGRLANPPVMVIIDPGQAAVRKALTAQKLITDVAECPRDDDRVRAAMAAADLVVIHDPLCPLVPPAFVRRLLSSASPGRVLVGVRPVVDTVKATLGGVITGTVDRDALRIVSSPVVAAGSRFSQIPDLTSALSDLSALVEILRKGDDVDLQVAPSSSSRVEDASGLELMASVEAVAQRTRER